MGISNILGILGFVLALGTFLLTRYERRSRLEVEFFTDWGDLFRDERGEEDEDSLLVARIINVGVKNVVIDRNSFALVGNDQKVLWWNCDFFGRDTFPVPLNPGDSAEVGMYVDAFADLVGANRRHGTVALELHLGELSGRKHRLGNGQKLLLEVHEVANSD